MAGPTRLLITGANGFVGSALTRMLQDDTRYQTTCALRQDTHPVACDRRVVVGDINGTTNWSTALEGVDAVIHLAARVHVMRETAGDPLSEFRKVNVEGTRALAQQAAQAGVRRLVYLSSIKVNGEAGTFDETDIPAPVDPYGVSKHEAEVVLREIASRTAMEVVIVRPPLVYGPGVKANFRMLFNLVDRGFPLPLGAVHNKRSFVAVQNLAHFLLHCVASEQAANQTFLVSDGDDLSTAELIRRMARALGKPARLVPVPSSLLKLGAGITGQGAVADRLLGSLQLNITKARTVAGWTPPVTMDEALRILAQR